MIHLLFITYIVYLIHLTNTTSVPKADTKNPENHISLQDPNILNLMVSYYDCANQNNLRQFSLLNVEECKQAPSDIQHTTTKQQYMLEQKQKESKLSNAKHILKLKKIGVLKHFHPLDDMIVYNGDRIHENFRKYLTLLNVKN